MAGHIFLSSGGVHRCDLTILCYPEQGDKLPLPGNYQVSLIDFSFKRIFVIIYIPLIYRHEYIISI